MNKNMAKKIDLIEIEKLEPYEKNARTHSPKQIEEIVESMKLYGFNNPILVDKKQGIIAGHGRLEAAKILKYKEVPVVVLDHLTDKQKRAYIIADNKIADNAGWDEVTLAEELESLKADGCNLENIGFTPKELDQLLEKELEKDDEEEDDSEGVLDTSPKFLLLVECKDELKLESLIDELKGRGFACKIQK